MNYYSGQHGSLYIDSVKAAAVTSWSFNASMSPLSTTSLEDTDSTFIQGLRTTTGACTLLYYQDGAKNDARDLIEKLVKERSAGATPGQAAEANNVVFKLYINDGTTTGKFITVEALLTNAVMTMSVGEVLSASVSFQANGAPISVDL